MSYTIILINIVIILVPKNYTSLHMIDVGQGDSILITTFNNKNILIDGGGSESSDYDVGEKVLVPYLLKNTNGMIDLIFISHFHEDHVEGILSVIKELRVNKIIIGIQNEKTYLYDELLKICKDKNIDIQIVKKGDLITIDNIKFEILYPTIKSNIIGDLNNNSLIFKAKICNNSILFTGDAEIKEEEKLIEEYKDTNKLDVDILKVGHHGSKTSSSIDFLNKVSPKLCLISVGVDNKFKHPHKEALNNLEKYTNNIYRTDEGGEISLKFYNNGTIKVKKMINN